MKRLIVAAFSMLAASLSAVAKPKPPAPCRVYFLVIENDTETGKQPMIGFTHEQEEWFKQNKDKSAGICPINTMSGGEKVFLDKSALVSKLNSLRLRPDSPIYDLDWSMQFAHPYQVFIASGTGSVASGMISRFKWATHTWVKLSPVTSTNKEDNPDIACMGQQKCDASLYSYSASLLRNALRKIRGWEKHRLAATPP